MLDGWMCGKYEILSLSCVNVNVNAAAFVDETGHAMRVKRSSVLLINC